MDFDNTEKLCRICLTAVMSDYDCLFSIELSTHTVKLSECGLLYKSLLNIQLPVADDKTTAYLCNHCILQLKLFNNFKIKAIESCTKLNKLYNFKEESDVSVDYRSDICDNDDTENIEIAINDNDNDDRNFNVTKDKLLNNIIDLKNDNNSISTININLVETEIEKPKTKRRKKCSENSEFSEEYYLLNLNNEDDVNELYTGNDDDDDDTNENGNDKRTNDTEFEEIQYLDEEHLDFDDDNEDHNESINYLINNEINSTNESSNNDIEDKNVSDVEMFIFMCKRCDKGFNTKKQLNHHRTNYHGRIKLCCDQCDKTFYFEESYKTHLRVHLGLPAYECPECPKTFNQKAHYEYHMKGHRNERDVQCDLCGKGFRTNSDLKIHMRAHNDERRYECDICGKRFRAHTHMTNHRYSHYEEKLECEICHQKYSCPNVLRTHIKAVHLNESPHECEKCKRKFKRKHHLKTHEKTHLKPNYSANNYLASKN